MTKNNIFKFFPDPIFRYKVSNYEKLNEDLLNYIYNIYNKDKSGLQLSNINGWHSKPFNLKEINSAPNKFFLSIIYINITFCSNLWFNIYTH